MTDRDPIPLAPTCPVCTSRDRVERHALKGWLCSGCWTVFSGGQGEWDAFRWMRDARARHQGTSA